MVKISTAAAVLLCGVMAAPLAVAQTDPGAAGSLDVHLRAVVVAPEATDLKVTAGGAPLTVTSSSITTSVIPEIDATYFLTNHIGVEVIAGTTQHSIHASIAQVADGAKLNLGSVWLLPPTVTAKYYFDSTGAFRPYVGAGVNYTLFYSPHSEAVPGMHYGNDWGTALQAGVDIPVMAGYFVNVDAKQLFLNDGVKADGGAIRAHANINPLLIGFGVGYRF